MRVYVAGPVTGRPRRNLAMFEHAAKQLVQAGHVPVVPHRHVPAQAEWHVAMRRCVALLRRMRRRVPAARMEGEPRRADRVPAGDAARHGRARAVPMDRVTCGGQSPPYEARR